MTQKMNWSMIPKWRQQCHLREPGWFLVGPHLLDGCWQTRFHLPLPPRLDSRNFHSQTSLGKSSLKITYIICFSLETASSPLLSINNSSHQPLGLIAPSLKAALMLTCLFPPILVSPSELFCCFWLQTPAVKSWGINGVLPSSPGSGSPLPTGVPAPHLRARSLHGLHSDSSNLMKAKGVIVWKSCFPGRVVLSTGGCVKSVCLREGQALTYPSNLHRGCKCEMQSQQGSGGIWITTATKENAVQTLHNSFVPKPIKLFLFCSCSLPRLPLSPFGADCATGRLGLILLTLVTSAFPRHIFFSERMVFQWENWLWRKPSVSAWFKQSEDWVPCSCGCLSLMSLSSWLLHVGCKAGRWGQGPHTQQCTPTPAPVHTPPVLQETQPCPWVQPHLKVKNNTKVLRKVGGKKKLNHPHTWKKPTPLRKDWT